MPRATRNASTLTTTTPPPARRQVSFSMFGQQKVRAQKQPPREGPQRPPSTAVSDALKNNPNGPADRQSTDPNRPRQGGPSGTRPSGGGGAGWLSRTLLLLALLII